jgi:hypothetical protein
MVKFWWLTSTRGPQGPPHQKKVFLLLSYRPEIWQALLISPEFLLLIKTKFQLTPFILVGVEKAFIGDVDIYCHSLSLIIVTRNRFYILI